MSIGFASAEGKTWIHTAGKITTVKEIWKNVAPQNIFLKSMAESCQSIVYYFKPENLAYINVANKMSINCDLIQIILLNWQTLESSLYLIQLQSTNTVMM